MNPKLTSILEKVEREKDRGNHAKALKRLAEAVEKFPGEIRLYQSAAELSLDAGESHQAVQFIKKAMRQFPKEREVLWDFAVGRLNAHNDPVLGKHLLEQSIKARDLNGAYSILKQVDDRTASELLNRTRTKKQSLTSALRGGHTLSGEIVINTLMESILCLRVGRIRDAVMGFIEYLDEHPLDCDALQAFLAEMEKAYPKKSGIRYALGCCYLTSKQFEKAIQKITQAMRMNADLAEDAVCRFERAKKEGTPETENLEVALVEAHLIGGNPTDATAYARSVLNRKPFKGPMILDLIRTYLDQGMKEFELHQFYIEVALLTGQTNRALDEIKTLCQDPETKRDMFDWLDIQSKTGVLPSEILIYFGEMVISEDRIDWAIEILRQAATSLPDVPTIIHILEKHVNLDPKIKALYEELGGDTEKGADLNSDIQYFEASEFSLSKYETPAEKPPDQAADTRQKGTGVDEISLTTYSEIEPAERFRERPTDASTETSADVSTETSIDASVERSTDASIDASTETSTDASQETLLEEATPEKTEEVFDQEQERDEKIAPSPLQEASQKTGPEEDFDSAFDMFLSGKLDNQAIIALSQRALDLGRLKEAKALLSFQPQTFDERVDRTTSLAEYYLHTDRPLSALVTLRSLELPKLRPEDRRRCLIKVAYCYRELNMFDAAHGVLLKLMSESPSHPNIERLARQNYLDYLKKNCGSAPVLEKTGLINQ